MKTAGSFLLMSPLFIDWPAVWYFLLVHPSLDVSYSLSVTIDILNVKNNSTPEKYKRYQADMRGASRCKNERKHSEGNQENKRQIA